MKINDSRAFDPRYYFIFFECVFAPFLASEIGRKGSLAEKGKIVGTLVEIESKGEPRQGGGVSLSLSSLSGIFFNQLDSIIVEYSTFCALR